MSESATSGRRRSRSRSRSRTRDQPQLSDPSLAGQVAALNTIVEQQRQTIQQQAQQLESMKQSILQLQFDTSNLHHRSLVDRHNREVARKNLREVETVRVGVPRLTRPKRLFVPAQLVVAGPDGQLKLRPATSDFPTNFPPEGIDLETLPDEQLIGICNAYGYQLQLPDAMEHKRAALHTLLSIQDM